MVIGICTIELYLPENHSLKGKRHVVKGVKEKLKSRFNVSVAEIDHLDVWQRATIGAVMLNTDHVYVDQELRKMVNFLEASQYAPYLFDYSIEFL